MARPLTWRSVRGGIAAFIAITAAALAILVYARVGALRGSTFRLYVATQEARGVIRGSDVWLGGQKVGVVKAITFQPASVDTNYRLLIETEIVDDARDRIRVDSKSEIRAGGSVIGAPVLSISIGTSRARGVRDGDTLRSARQIDVERMTSDVGLVTSQLPGVMQEVKEVGRLAAGARANAASLIEPRSPARELAARFRALGGGTGESRGSLARIRDPQSPLVARAKHAMAGVDTVRMLFATQASAVGRFRRDTTLFTTMGELRREMAAVRALASSSDGTVGRFRGDSAIFIGLDSAFKELTALFTDLRKHPLRYIVF